MIILDGTYEYDTEFIDNIVDKPERTSIERDILNAFSRHAYYLYTRIRDCVTTRKCKRLSLNTVRERLQDQHKLKLTMRLAKINEQQINYILNYVEKNFPRAIR